MILGSAPFTLLYVVVSLVGIGLVLALFVRLGSAAVRGFRSAPVGVA